MSITLEEVIQNYLADTEFQQLRIQRAARRDASIPQLQAITNSFIQAETDIQSFRIQLEKALRVGEDWGALGFGFMMELNKFGKYHNDAGSYAEIQFRHALNGLNAKNLGQRIEQFYKFLLQERDRLRRDDKSSNTIVAARNSAFIISLFAFWLDTKDRNIIYYDSLRKGIFQLIRAHLTAQPNDLPLGRDTIEVHSNANHQACLQVLDYIVAQDPQIKRDTYWAENFSLWVTQHLQSLAEPTNTLIKEIDRGTLLAKTPTQVTTIHDEPAAYVLTDQPTPNTVNNTITAASSTEHIIKHEPLRAVSESLLPELMQEVQRSILVDEDIIKQIYYALLAGHVILSGPPGTGKTELARIIPEILWKSQLEPPAQDPLHDPEPSTKTAYTTHLVTATDEWSTRTLISGIAPQSQNGTVSYHVQYGHLTSTILKNWSFQGHEPEEWSTVTLQRNLVTTTSGFHRGTPQQFRGQWLVIDEFNRAPIDLALGDALTALGGNDVLRVAIDGGSATLPIPQDFRIIGTLNSFDRSYLNQISEALKRRFSFIEINPPGRKYRVAEQSIVLYKALKKINHLSATIESSDDGSVYWQDHANISPDTNGSYSILWEHEQLTFHEVFDYAWSIFEVIRIYRQLGTAQAIAMLQQMLIQGILEHAHTYDEWSKALDRALCNTIADQLQVLLPDEVEVLHTYLTVDHTHFSDAYHTLLADLASTPQRLYGQLLALGNVHDSHDQAFLEDAKIEQIVTQDHPQIASELLTQLFHLDCASYALPQFTRRLRTFKAERGL
jgi:hypothetical protein